MVKRRVSILRNKKGHPIYSREDIREQYCITKKEVEVLERAKSIKLFGCLRDPHESSPCTRNNILFSCINKKRSSQDDNEYVQSTEPTRDHQWRSSYDRGAQDEKAKEQEERSAMLEGGQESGDDEYVLSGFRKRPKSFYRTDSKSRLQWVDSEASEHSGDILVGGMRRRKLESSASLGSTSQQSFDSDRESSKNVQRPSQLSFGGRGEPVHYFQPSRSVDELNDTATTSRRREGPVTTRIAKTPDILLDDRRQKHVSFDNHSLIRSNTIGGGLEDVDSGPAATSTPLSTQRRTFSPPERNRSQERLLDRSVRPLYDYGDYSTATIKSSDASLASSSYRGSLQYRPRRALMKTQATQTELTFKTKHLLPAYLTLSPRAATSQYHRAKTSRHRSSTRLMKSQSAYGALGSEESDEDVMEVDLVGKRHRLIRSSTARASIRRQKAIDSSQEEIMVSFKPAASPPKVPKEVLIGERPLPRPLEKERKTGAIPYSKTLDSHSGADKVQAVEIVVKTYRGKVISPRSESVQITPKTANSGRSTTAKIEDSELTESAKEPLNSTSQAMSSFETEDVISSEKEKKQEEEKPSPEDSSEISGERSPSGRLIRFKPEPETMESSSAKSSSGDSTQQISRQMWTAGAAFHEQDNVSNHSDESPTMTTEDALSSEALLAQESADRRRKEYLENYQQVNAKSQALFDNLTSPDSESSSSVFTERETSRSEVSTSSSNKMAKSGSSRSETEENSESSDYITAAEPCSFLAHTVADNSFESASSASLFSSPSSTQHKSSSSVDDSGKEKWKSLQEADTYHDVSEESPFQTDDADLTPTMTSKPMDFGDIKPPSPLSESFDDYRESSDESTKKESSCSEDEGGIQETAETEGFSTLETPDSDRTGDLTPVFDASPEPLSSLQEPQTVIEIRSDATSDELLESINGSSPVLVSNNEDYGEDDSMLRRLKDVETESESTESSSVYSGQEEAGATGFIEREDRGPISSYLKKDRKASDELSTVSEVSEESSNLEIARPKRMSRRAEYRSSTSEETDTNNGDQRLAKLGGSLDLETKSSSSEYIPSETTTPSFDSTTSGSFILENGSYADNESYNGQTDEVTAQYKSLDEKEVSEEKKDIQEMEREGEEEERPKSEPARRYSESGLDDLQRERSPSNKNSEPKERIQTKDDHMSKGIKDVPAEFKESSSYSTTSDQSEKVLPSSSLSSSSSLTQPSYREEVERHPSLSTWRSEGAIPKQRFQDADTRRRRERARMRSDGGVSSFDQSQQLIPPGRHHSRSKSRSPEKSADDLELSLPSRVLCSQCGEKIRDQSPLSTGMWERQYQRSYWEPPRPPPEPPSPHLDHHHHQTYLWRQRDRDRLSAAPGPYSDVYGQPTSSRFSQAYGVSQPRTWSESTVPPPEMDLYADEDEDAGIHSESYRNSTWIYVSDGDELAVWKQAVEPQEEVQSDTSSVRVLTRSDSLDSTASEHEFLKQYQAVTHRMIHRKSSVEMYKRLANRTFEVDKRVTVQRNNGEFGFRIHGSKPVVVSAIERGTPAETCGLEVGDIIVSINGINVLEASHSEVVRIAHTGTEVLKMEVTRTCHVLAPVLPPGSPAALVYSGFLQRLSVRSVTSRRWCRRWFVIKVDGVLYWYRTSKDHEPLGALVLQNQTISRVPDAGSPHAFKVSKFDGCPHYFSADDEETASRWISALNQVAATASRVDPYLEQCVHNAKLPSISVPTPDCHGFLAKLSQRWKQWKRRYFLLKDASLYFYADRNAKVALGIFHLHGYKVQSCSIQGKKNTFEAIPPEPRLKHLYFLADSENEKKRWLAAMEYSIDRWIKVG